MDLKEFEEKMNDVSHIISEDEINSILNKSIGLSIIPTDEQLIVTIEEMTELSTELLNLLSSDGIEDLSLSIIEEFCDVKICICFLKKYYDIPKGLYESMLQSLEKALLSSKYSNIKKTPMKFSLYRQIQLDILKLLNTLIKTLTKNLRRKNDMSDVFGAMYRLEAYLTVMMQLFEIPEETIKKGITVKANRLANNLKKFETEIEGKGNDNEIEKKS